MFSLCNQQDFCCCCCCFFAFVFFFFALLKNDESRRRERDKHLSLLLFPSQTSRGFPASFHVAAARRFKACTKPPATSAKPCEVHEECESHLNILCLRLRSESDIMHILKNRGRGARAPSPPVLFQLPYWCLLSRVLDVAILARRYFAGFYFVISIGNYQKRHQISQFKRSQFNLIFSKCTNF